ncbi:hypothetical protein GCM10028796_42380 [Ramlibacter monticola]|uniref:C-type cytochrome n=1 Tax=Ramlibacter monticola TaxID=1926872 RepID=A0A937CUL9_9BURK|nr:c-type cytochrome [Ramlibacter monticola]MBL0392838.1 c-type cytochrome [Ramlibacter monticola]
MSGAVLLAAALGAPPAGGQQSPRKPGTAASAPAAAAAKAPAASTNYAQRFATQCAACHGANGRNEPPLIPVLAGQPSLYAITQLFLFREGRRGADTMAVIAKTLTDDDLRGFSDFIGTLPPVPAPPPVAPPDAARMEKGRALAQQHKCLFCHGAELEGGQQVPRIAGQHEDYLRMTLRGFQSGARPAYTQAMPAAVSQIPVADLDTLAYYAARFSVAAPKAAGK